MKLAEINIDEIVSAVLKDIQHNAAGPSTISATPEQTTNSNGIVLIAGRIITAELLSQNTNPAARIQFEAQAIVTPAARDYIKEQGLQVSSKCNSEQTSNQNQARKQATKNWLNLVVQSSESLESAIASVSREMGITWKQQAIETTEKAAQRAIQEIKSDDKASAVIFTEKTATAACLVNRNELIRGVAVRRPSELSEIAELDANVVCLPGRGLSFTEYRNILRNIISR